MSLNFLVMHKKRNPNGFSNLPYRKRRRNWNLIRFLHLLHCRRPHILVAGFLHILTLPLRLSLSPVMSAIKHPFQLTSSSSSSPLCSLRASLLTLAVLTLLSFTYLSFTSLHSSPPSSPSQVRYSLHFTFFTSCFPSDLCSWIWDFRSEAARQVGRS